MSKRIKTNVLLTAMAAVMGSQPSFEIYPMEKTGLFRDVRRRNYYHVPPKRLGK